MNSILDKTIDLLKEIRLLECRAAKETEEKKDLQCKASIYSAMLADIAETFFGGSNNDQWRGINVPTIISEVHAGWACSPFSQKTEDLTYLDLVKDVGNVDRTKWRNFIEKLKHSVKEDRG
jgi:hypothetical protein